MRLVLLVLGLAIAQMAFGEPFSLKNHKALSADYADS